MEGFVYARPFLLRPIFLKFGQALFVLLHFNESHNKISRHPHAPKNGHPKDNDNRTKNTCDVFMLFVAQTLRVFTQARHK
jgi:hypothetical protein